MSHRSPTRSPHDQGHHPHGHAHAHHHGQLRAQPKLAKPPAAAEIRLDAGSRQLAGAPRAGRVLDHRRLARRDGRMVGHHRHLFRVPRRRADAAARPPGADAIRLRGPHRGTARAGRQAREPPVARSGAGRRQARSDRAPSGDTGVARVRAVEPARHDPDRFDQACAAPHAGDPRAASHAEALADQRHRHPRSAARARGAA